VHGTTAVEARDTGRCVTAMLPRWSKQMRGGENEQREREAVVRGVFMRASSVRHGHVEAMRRQDSEDGRPWPSSSF
jgi:hypothetical protein